MSDAAPPAGGALWMYAVQIYTRPAVREALLRLQYVNDVNLLLLLWRMWLHSIGCNVRPEVVDEVLERSGPWSDEVIGGMRKVRDAIKRFSDLVDERGAMLACDEAESFELSLEKLQIDAIERMSHKGLTSLRDVDLLDYLVDCPELKRLPREVFLPLIAALKSR